MIFRAIFWIGLVALLMPHEPDLGFGRPAAIDTTATNDLAQWAKTRIEPNLRNPQSLCRYNADTCAAGANLVDTFRAGALRSLAEVRADIRANSRKTVLTH